MAIRKTTVLFKFVAVCLIISFLLPSFASAAVPETVQPMASYYLEWYSAYICTLSRGRFEVWYDVTATTYMDDLGVLSIRLYESTDNVNWTWLKTYLPENYSSMLVQDEIHYVSSVSFQGVVGRYYKAYVCIWAGKDGGGDSRYIWTPVEQAV